MDILKIMSIILGAGGLGAFLTYKLGNRKQDNSEFVSVMAEYKALVAEYKAEVIKLREEVEYLKTDSQQKREDVQNLRNQLLIFESSHIDIPVPMWLKDTNGVMLFLNEEYSRTLLQPIGKQSSDYIGFTDFDVWDKATAKEFRSHDKDVMRKKKAVQFKEIWEGSNGNIYEGTVLKYPRFLNRNTVIGIGGIILEIKLLKNENN
jgi:hypothetical protein